MTRYMKRKQRKYKVTVIRRSCLTGVPVWLYRGPSLQAASQAYRKACRAELEYMRNLRQEADRRCRNIMNILTACTASMPLTAEMTAGQKEAARKLKAICSQLQPAASEFFEHIVEEKRRQDEASARWRGKRDKWFQKF